MTISKASGDFSQSTQDKTLLVFLNENKHWLGRMTLIPSLSFSHFRDEGEARPFGLIQYVNLYYGSFLRDFQEQ